MLFRSKMIRRKNKNGTSIHASTDGANQTSVEVSHPQWVNAKSLSKSGSTGLVLQNGTKLENLYQDGRRSVVFSDGLTLQTQTVTSPVPGQNKRSRVWYTLGIPGLASFFVLKDATGVPYINLPSSTSSAAASSGFERLSVHQFASQLAAEDASLKVQVAKDQSIKFIHSDKTEVSVRD